MIGDRLKILREEKGLRQADLANKLGVSQQTISQYEKDTREPDPSMAKKISSFFGVSLDYLYGNTDERSPAHKIKEAVQGNPELQDVWEKMQARDDLQLAFKQLSDMSPREIREILRYIKMVRDEEAAEDY